MIDYEGMVRDFHIKYDHYISKGETPPIDVIYLRDRLIEEEAHEFSLASGMLRNDPKELFTNSKVLIADALADLLYVVFGAAIAYNIPIEAVFEEVHRSNMSKSRLKNEYGKTIKGPNYFPPDILGILRGER